MASDRPYFICTEVVARATDFMESALPLTDSLRVRLHLAHCADCRRFVRQLELTVETCAGLGTPPATAEPSAALRAHFRALTQRRPKT